MEIILLEKIKNLGVLGDQVSVKPGYGRNFLIPQGKAVPATKTNIAEFEARRAELEKTQKEQFEQAQARAEKLQDLTIVLSRKAAMEGKLFGSIHINDIVDAVAERGITLHKKEVSFPDGAIRLIGEYDVSLQLHPDVETTLKLQVIPEE